jgi:RNA polymerase sigma-70 factor, ECF subfamily
MAAAAYQPNSGAPGEWPHRTPEEEARLRSLVLSNHPFIWRVVRRLGIPEADADDVTQEVFLVAAHRLSDIEDGKERSFLYSVAVRVAANARRAGRRRQSAYDRFEIAPREPVPLPDHLSDQRNAREMLDELLESLPDDLREVLVLHEIEEIGVAEAAQILNIPVGTVGSRLRRGREKFHAAVARKRAQAAFRTGAAE